MAAGPRLAKRGSSPNVEPTKRELDELTSDIPIALMARDSHSLWLNLGRARPRER